MRTIDPKLPATVLRTGHRNRLKPPFSLRHLGDGVGVDPGCGMEDDPARGGGVEHTVDDDTVKV